MYSRTVPGLIWWNRNRISSRPVVSPSLLAISTILSFGIDWNTSLRRSLLTGRSLSLPAYCPQPAYRTNIWVTRVLRATPVFRASPSRISRRSLGTLNDTVSVLALGLRDRVWLTGAAPGEESASLLQQDAFSPSHGIKPFSQKKGKI